MTNDENTTDEPSFDHVLLSTLRRRDGRTVAYATAGDPNGAPVLFFYPAGGNRRMLASLHTAATSDPSAPLRLICINRPGTGDTTPPLEADPKFLVETVCFDAISILDELGVARAGLLFMCAGAPFALAFAARHPDRTAGRSVGIAPYIQPADCPDAKALHRFGAQYVPLGLLSPLVGTVFSSISMSLTHLPTSMVLNSMRSKLTEKEREAFSARFSEKEFTGNMSWMFEEKKDVAADISVLMSPGVKVGIDYDKVGGEVWILHGENDQITPIGASEWLELQLPSATLIRLEASHEGALFLLHPETVEAIKWLGKA